MLDFIIENLLLVFLLEVSAAIAGSYYLKKRKDPEIENRLLVYYLWLVVFVEFIGIYPLYGYFTDYSTLPFIKDSVFERNFWWYNSFAIVKYVVFFIYFMRQLQSPQMKKILFYLTGFYIVTSILNLMFSGVFFVAYSAYSSILGTLFLVLIIFLYYLEVLKSNRILHFYKKIPFYISIGVLIWHLVVTPLFIYNHYFSLQSPAFVALHAGILRFANVFLYGIIILSFLVCTQRNKQQRL